VDKDEAYISAIRDMTLDFMLRNTENAEDAACVVMGTIYAMMIFMQQPQKSVHDKFVREPCYAFHEDKCSQYDGQSCHATMVCGVRLG
jgi:hypothetical protein